MQIACDEEEDRLRSNSGDVFMPDNVFESCVGRFWSITETRPYMEARFGLVEATLKIKTHEVVQVANDHARDILRLNRSDNMGARELVPSLLIRL